MAKVRFYLKTDKGKTPTVYLVIRHGSRQAMLSTGFTCSERDWNASAQEFRKSQRGYRDLNRRLDELSREADDAIRDLETRGQEPTPKRVKRILEHSGAEEEPCFLAYCSRLLETWKGRWSYGTFVVYRTVVRKLRAYVGTGPQDKQARLLFSHITPDYLRGFQVHLGKINSANTIHKNLSTLKYFFAQAMEDGVIPYQRNPFESLRYRKEPVLKTKLTTDELRRLRDYELDEDSLMADVRRWFFFAFYAGGMRVSDVCLMKRKHIVRDDTGAVRSLYRMGKTKDVHGVLLVEEAVAILEYYGWEEKKPGERIFPALDGYDLSTAQARRVAVGRRASLMRKYLTILAEKCGIDKRVTMHLARHSIAGYLLEQGYDVYVIQQVLGHASVRQTEEYLRGFKGKGPDEAMRDLDL